VGFVGWESSFIAHDGDAFVLGDKQSIKDHEAGLIIGIVITQEQYEKSTILVIQVPVIHNGTIVRFNHSSVNVFF
jgi:hypothetical protein